MSAYDTASAHESHQLHEPLFTSLFHALRTFFRKQNQLKIAITLSEAGDVEGAKALLDKRTN